MTKKVKNWLTQLQEPERSKAINNTICPDVYAVCLAEAIAGAFNWENTPEGHEYWEAIFQKYLEELDFM
jgi:hypothetical protein